MLVTKTAPEFKAMAVMPDNSFKEVSLSDYSGKKVVLFFYPLDFTFVWPTELIAFDNRLKDFEKRNVQVLGCSVDSHFSHLKWKELDTNNGGIGNISYPLLSDITKSIARSYDVLLGTTAAYVEIGEEADTTTVGGGVSLRGSFLIDEKGVVRHEIKNDLPLGRNIDEMLRLIDALDFHNEHGDVCPAGWNKGEDGMNPSHDGMKKYVSENAAKL